MDNRIPPAVPSESARRAARGEPRLPTLRKHIGVLGATLAIGSCQLAGCGDVEEERPEPSLASAAPAPAPVEEEPAAPEPTEPIVDGDEARVATLDASPGFTPDPMTADGTTAGGPLDASDIDERCTGWIAAQPDVILHTVRPNAELTLMAASREDVTLLVMAPDGTHRCAGEGPHASIRGPLEAGTHRVWVGTRDRDTAAPFVFGVSELDDSTPDGLLH